jgi:hypothetical protein
MKKAYKKHHGVLRDAHLDRAEAPNVIGKIPRLEIADK